MKKRTKFWSIGAVIVILAIPAFFVIGFFALLAGYIIQPYLAPAPRLPEIQKAEFEFELTYTLNGEEHNVKDVFVCEYDGVGMLGDGSFGSAKKGRTWKGYIKSTGEEGILLCSDEKNNTYCSVGDAGYYMGDPDYPQSHYLNDKTGFKVDTYSKSWELVNLTDLQTAYEIEIISFEIEEPIQNTFK